MTETSPKLIVEGLTVRYGDRVALREVHLRVPKGAITALVGPSGCGKSTLLRALNRMHDLSEGVAVSGRVYLDGEDLYAPDADASRLRRRVGMVFQRPNPLPASIFDNVAFGPRLHGAPSRSILASAVERALREAALWDEVRDRLREPAGSLSGGQQQRLCIARALAVEPEVLLLDEPSSALDPIAAEAIEALMGTLRGRYTQVVVTHSMAQARRVADHAAFVYLGEVVEQGRARDVLDAPKDARTQEFLRGRTG